MLDLKEQIMAQIWIAFGQGTGSLRVSRATAVALYDQYHPHISRERMEDWEEQAVQVLERIRGIGRLAAATATGRGAIVVAPDDVAIAVRAVQNKSGDHERPCPIPNIPK